MKNILNLKYSLKMNNQNDIELGTYQTNNLHTSHTPSLKGGSRNCCWCNCCKKLCTYLCILIVLAGVVSCYVFVNMKLVQDKHDCEDKVPNELVFSKILRCDGRFISCEFQVGKQSKICVIDYGKRFNCDFPTNTSYIYKSADNDNCSFNKEGTDCDNSLDFFLFNFFWSLVTIPLIVFIILFLYKKN